MKQKKIFILPPSRQGGMALFNTLQYTIPRVFRPGYFILISGIILITCFFFCEYSYADTEEEDAILTRLFKDIPPYEDKFTANFGPKAGILIPNSGAMRQAYGNIFFSYGFYLDVWFDTLGLKFEVETCSAERVLPVNEANKWRNLNSTLSLTPFFLSFEKKLNISADWNLYIGIGGGAAVVRERFRGDAYVKDSSTGSYDYRYVDFCSVDTLWGIQLFIELMKKDHVGFEIKYSFFPPNSDGGFRDFGGLGAYMTFSF